MTDQGVNVTAAVCPVRAQQRGLDGSERVPNRAQTCQRPRLPDAAHPAPASGRPSRSRFDPRGDPLSWTGPGTAGKASRKSADLKRIDLWGPHEHL